MRRLECCCCGRQAPALKQWWNRDTGYGLCGKCARMIQARKDYDAEEFERNYGHKGIHWFPSCEVCGEPAGEGDVLCPACAVNR